MIISAFINAGLNIESLKTELKELNLDGWDFQLEEVRRCGITASKVNIITDKKKDKSRHLAEIFKIIDDSNLEQKQKTTIKKIFTKIADAEAKVHKTDVKKVHFHEVGSLDAIIDITSAVVAMDLLSIDKVYSSQVAIGQGMIQISHGEVPVPAPATVEILKGIPLRRTNINGELTTPTGAAILTSLSQSFEGIPANFQIQQIGYGAGNRVYEGKTNFLRILIGEVPGEINDLIPEEVYLITTEIDDMNPEIFSSIMDDLFNIGCLDAHFLSTYMKKNRPGVKLEVLSNIKTKEKIIDYILKNTSTFGIRVEEIQRLCLKRESDVIDTKYGKVKVKNGYIGNKLIKVSPEYESCKTIAKNNNINLITVYNEVLKKINL